MFSLPPSLPPSIPPSILFSVPPSPPSHRLLTLWFDYGHYPDVHDAVTEGLKTIDIDTWLQVRGGEGGREREGWRGREREGGSMME